MKKQTVKKRQLLAININAYIEKMQITPQTFVKNVGLQMTTFLNLISGASLSHQTYVDCIAKVAKYVGITTDAVLKQFSEWPAEKGYNYQQAEQLSLLLALEKQAQVQTHC
ncbi:hypothetical protein [Brochothrix campestris]|uniref:HTH cro/C1-type domain-containing protein n=1 Tax=Brochothrix campestris FSL F6-1037 TaxID=1265861 RepID=W7CP30_9LIST|nr:hypothetical protein [Brochothrix campestris]EUJ41344.1 hypothetical protein BCAMP_03510 [Brochothrix campestris FSL F6-1037]